ncbi:MAG: ribulose-phosphate 3-epimerase [Micrococcales bacterium]|nr:ribulose-phosphate 3-epimerase [Micrococcales bacterium]
MALRIAPSILTADPLDLGSAIASLTGADDLHVDVMDLHFVPNLAFGPASVKRVCEVSPVPVDVHLMIFDPDRWAVTWAETGASSVTFHAEAAKAPFRLANVLHDMGVRVGLAINPGTPVASVKDLLGSIDMLLLMTVEPGFGGQALVPSSYAKVAEARRLTEDSGLSIDIQVDGGVSRKNISRLAAAGATVFVAGSAVLGAADPAEEIATLRALAEEGARQRSDHVF